MLLRRDIVLDCRRRHRFGDYPGLSDECYREGRVHRDLQCVLYGLFLLGEDRWRNRDTFPKGETRAAFVDAYMISVSGTLTSQSGKTQDFQGVQIPFFENLLHYQVRCVQCGGNSISISFDDTIEDVELTEVELND